MNYMLNCYYLLVVAMIKCQKIKNNNKNNNNKIVYLSGYYKIKYNDKTFEIININQYSKRSSRKKNI